MKQTFHETIKGHSLEFNRLLYPVRYQIQLEDPEYKGMLIEIVKDKNGDWELKQAPGIPDWFFDGFEKIRVAITKNEAS
jgi:hypothetical protein